MARRSSSDERPGGSGDQFAAELLETARALSRAAARVAGPGERSTLTGAQFDVLLEIRRYPGLTVSQLAERLHLARNTVSTLVGQLHRAGLLVRAGDASDARVTRLDLAPAAAERMAAWRARRADAVQVALAGLTARQLAAIERALDPLRVLATAVEATSREG
jgi:DNA-binding MarR family transcriptional regulator